MATPAAPTDTAPATGATTTTPKQHPTPTALRAARTNLAYLIDPSSNAGPSRRRTRALLRSLRYTAIFVFWRLLRYAKYALVGAATAAVAGTAIGSVVSGAAFVVAPTGILGGGAVGLLWGLGRVGWRVLARRARTGDARVDEKAGAGETGWGERRRKAEEREERGFREDAW
ncbi:uncharacterized protein K452DRAFT_116869 [Aplosporella prunicola CBS 121167]|uniref:Uncharacterized protein n=1 Tax=Aplosporella prunicola CBS 121167 TaxID=1176127 RepID=A0A6A6AY90_9PEZI|nr:uncharacterized protein K452DRAFT_116869 [Aplosporella prunicola CBS 121167]KAF2136899.1 hypothetical protein K452DRAFT_116869 [Aplosporella prunicola CBS 121167]